MIFSITRRLFLFGSAGLGALGLPLRRAEAFMMQKPPVVLPPQIIIAGINGFPIPPAYVDTTGLNMILPSG